MFLGGQLACKLLFTNLYQQKSWQTLILFTFLKKGWNQNLSRFMDSQKNFLLRRICILSNICQVYAVNARIRRSFSIWSLGPESRKKNGRKSTPKYELKFGFFFQDQILHCRAEWVGILFKRLFLGCRHNYDLNSNFPPKLKWLFLKCWPSEHDLMNFNSF